MSLAADEQSYTPAASRRRAANAPRGRARLGRAGLSVALLLAVCVLAAGCGGGTARPGVAALGKTTATATEPVAAPSAGKTNPAHVALAFVGCMRTHGEPNMPEPNFTKDGSHVSVSINANSGLDPNSPQFAAATKACKHLLPNNGGPSQRQVITPADQADYLKGAACMRAHGVPDFPDPTFENNTVTFHSQTAIDTNSPQYERALTTCQKLIPAGLPYSSSAGP